ncbi:MAG TPA: cyanophycin synthetase [Candidatus Limnocylindrales bacterium]|nr:cyanophycin synthetase [Candidatus Limnocylindrales bacterium]
MSGRAAIGAGLEPAREARPIRPGERIHILGAAGAGASAAALLGHHASGDLSGCDPGGPSSYTPPLLAAGIPLVWEHNPAHVTGTGGFRRPDRLGVTKALTAIAPDHPELEAARAAGLPLESWQQVVADAAFGRTLVGVAGTHGKSTSAGWLVHVLVEAGVDPSAFVGALLPGRVTGGLPSTARWGRGDAFVVEADEYAGNFDAYRPAIAIVTSAEWDHPDVFADRDAVVSAFESWLRAAAAAGHGPVLVANIGDPGVADLVERLAPDWAGSIVVTAVVDVASQRLASHVRDLGERYAGDVIDEAAGALVGRIVVAEPEGTTVEFASPRKTYLAEPTTVRLATAGRHNVANALGVLAAARTLGVSADVALRGLSTFVGVGRRLERKGDAAGVVVYDDYGHHPTAIRETLAAVRQREPGRRVWAVYEPLTYHRTAALLDDFAAVLAGADAVAIADIWAGRDPDTTVASAAGLAEAVARHRPGIVVNAPGSVEATASWLAGEVRSGDAVLVMGGGRSYRIGELLLEQLERA